MKNHLSSVLILLLIPGTLLFTACRKKKDTIAKVHVVDSSGEPVSGAEVRLVPVPTIPNHPELIPNKITSTNRSGEAIFHFNEDYQLGQAGVAVLNIEVEKDGAEATGIIKVEQETTSEETVAL